MKLTTQGKIARTAGAFYLDRTTFTPLQDSRVQQVIVVSTDAGVTWRDIWTATHAHRATES